MERTHFRALALLGVGAAMSLAAASLWSATAGAGGNGKHQHNRYEVLVTVADATDGGGGTRGILDANESGEWEQGEVFFFEQPLLAVDSNGDPAEAIGTNAGFCIATAVDTSFYECTWTLTFDGDGHSSITVSGQENATGDSWVAIVGGTGDYTGASGEMLSQPEDTPDGPQFRQTLYLERG